MFKYLKNYFLFIKNDFLVDRNKPWSWWWLAPAQEDEINNYCITSWSNPQKTFHEVSLIQLVNKYMKSILGDNFTSHSFRQGLITEMGSQNINPRVIQSYIGHRNVSTTLNYIKPTENDVKNSLVRWFVGKVFTVFKNCS